MNAAYGVPGTRGLPNLIGREMLAAPHQSGQPAGYGAPWGVPGAFVLSETAATYPNYYPPFRTGMGAAVQGPAFPSGIAPGYQGVTGYGDYGVLKKNAQAQCSKWQGELDQARAGIGKGILGIFGGKGLFGNRKTVLERKVNKWCTKAEAEKKAAQQAASFAESLVPSLPPPGLPPQGAAVAAAPDNTMLLVGLGGLALLAVGAVVLTRK